MSACQSVPRKAGESIPADQNVSEAELIEDLKAGRRNLPTLIYYTPSGATDLTDTDYENILPVVAAIGLGGLLGGGAYLKSMRAKRVGSNAKPSAVSSRQGISGASRSSRSGSGNSGSGGSS